MGSAIFRTLVLTVLVAALADLILLGLILYEVWEFLG